MLKNCRGFPSFRFFWAKIWLLWMENQWKIFISQIKLVLKLSSRVTSRSLEGIFSTSAHFETHNRGKNTYFSSVFFVAVGPGGFWPLAPPSSGQHPLFWLFSNCPGIIEGPDVNSFAGLSFLIFGLGINPASTCCGEGMTRFVWLLLVAISAVFLPQLQQ